jgi:hypothetical protein
MRLSSNENLRTFDSAQPTWLNPAPVSESRYPIRQGCLHGSSDDSGCPVALLCQIPVAREHRGVNSSRVSMRLSHKASRREDEKSVQPCGSASRFREHKKSAAKRAEERRRGFSCKECRLNRAIWE